MNSKTSDSLLMFFNSTPNKRDQKEQIISTFKHTHTHNQIERERERKTDWQKYKKHKLSC